LQNIIPNLCADRAFTTGVILHTAIGRHSLTTLNCYNTPCLQDGDGNSCGWNDANVTPCTDIKAVYLYAVRQSQALAISDLTRPNNIAVIYWTALSLALASRASTRGISVTKANLLELRGVEI